MPLLHSNKLKFITQKLSIQKNSQKVLSVLKKKLNRSFQLSCLKIYEKLGLQINWSRNKTFIQKNLIQIFLRIGVLIEKIHEIINLLQMNLFEVSTIYIVDYENEIMQIYSYLIEKKNLLLQIIVLFKPFLNFILT